MAIEIKPLVFSETAITAMKAHSELLKALDEKDFKDVVQCQLAGLIALMRSFAGDEQTAKFVEAMVREDGFHYRNETNKETLQ